MSELRRSLLVVGGFALMLLGGASVAAFDQSANLGVSIFTLLIGSTVFLFGAALQGHRATNRIGAATKNPLRSVR